MGHVTVPVPFHRPRRPSPAAVGVAYLALVGLVALAFALRFQPTQVPGYLLLVGFDLLQNPLAPGLTGLAFDVAFHLYLVIVAVLVASVVGRA
ncbi:hypothetical protein [Halogeometricum limi]|uniref:Uncharacterized protein n=1 Tax=Halogeometricum limi TaxID=555875 RepID=A0A1I6FVC0_9EURY|nr:hypothetical protein [Halogeometricum limi]SFR33873.1 hypothetical protein SAMN04488124_0371 [Halogeometricum limi]